MVASFLAKVSRATVYLAEKFRNSVVGNSIFRYNPSTHFSRRALGTPSWVSS
jgi:hypothetical protein